MIGFRWKRGNAWSREVLMFRFLLRNLEITIKEKIYLDSILRREKRPKSKFVKWFGTYSSVGRARDYNSLVAGSNPVASLVGQVRWSEMLGVCCLHGEAGASHV